MLLYAGSKEEAFREIYARFSGRIYGYFLSKLRSKENSDDLVQEFFRKVHEHRSEYDPKYKVEAWFFTIARNLLFSFFRKSKHGEIEFNENKIKPVITKADDPSVDLARLEMALEKLPREEQKLLRLRYFNEAEFEELAERFGKTEVNIRKIISRSIEKIRKVLKNDNQ